MICVSRRITDNVHFRLRQPPPWSPPAHYIRRAMEQTHRQLDEGDRALGRVFVAYWAAVSHLLGLLLALAGQRRLGSDSVEGNGVVLLLAALVFFLLPLLASPISIPSTPSRRAGAFQPLIPGTIWRFLFALTSAILGLLAYIGFGENDLMGGLWYWLGAILYFLLAFAEQPAGGWLAAGRRWWAESDRRALFALLLITMLAAFFRAFRLAELPAEMTSDHAEKLLDVYDVLRGQRPIFFSRNTGREMAQFYLTAGLIHLTPLELGHLALKVGTALVGIITVPLTFFLGKELYGREVGLLASFFLAISHWHVAITRVGLRFPFTAAFAVLALFFLIRALRRNRRNDWLAAGLILGAGLHTYTAMRIVPLLFLVFIGIKLVADRASRGQGRHSRRLAFWQNAVLGGLASLLLFLPLLRYLTERPQLFWFRAASRAQANVDPAQLVAVFWQNLQDALLMFNYRGDVVPANTIPGAPELETVSAALLVLGMATLLLRLIRHREGASAYVLAAFFVLLLPSVLSLAFPEENPSVVRTGGAIPFVMIIVALPLQILKRRFWVLPSRFGRHIFAMVLTGLLLFALADNYRWYFVDYDRHIRQSLWNATEMGEAVRAFTAAEGALENVYHVAYPHWVDTRAIAITAGDITWRNAVLDLGDFEEHATDPAPKLYLLYPGDDEALARLTHTFPEGTVRRYKSPRPGKDFLLYRVPARLP